MTGPAAMVQPVRPWPYRFLREKNCVAWILTYACVIEWPLRAVRRSLGRLRGLLRTFSSLQASKVSILERETSAQIGEGLTWASSVAVISGSSVQSLL